MKTRKIAANYIYLPGHPLLHNGHVILRDNRLDRLVDTGGQILEIPRLEFYGGMLVDDSARLHATWQPGDPLLPRLDQIYSRAVTGTLALLQGADLIHFRWLPATRLVPLPR